VIRILNAEPAGYSAEAHARLQAIGEVVAAPLSRPALLAQLPAYDVLIVRLAHQVDREVIDAGRRLKFIVSATTGLDHIDLEYAQSKGITVVSLRGETEFLRGIRSTAEHTWALLLALLRRIPQASASVRAGAWDRDAFRGNELAGKRLGIVGLGRIGQMVACYGQAFGMSTAAYDPAAPEWPHGVEPAPDLAALLGRSDVLTLHVPLTAETALMMGEAQVAQLPAGAVLVNTSRGDLVDEKALLRALERGHLAGAALDVITHERQPALRQGSPLLAYARDHENLLVTPHIAGATVEAMARAELFVAHKLARVMAGPA
jgi:D-3-phosphoglycerate dehydrogenase